MIIDRSSLDNQNELYTSSGLIEVLSSHLTNEKKYVPTNFSGDINQPIIMYNDYKYEVLHDISWTIYNGYEYSLIDDLSTYNDHKNKAKDYNAIIVTILDASENDFVKNLANNENIWLGLNDIEIEGLYKWENNTEYNYNNWGVGQPSSFNDSDDYVVMQNNGKWYSYSYLNTIDYPYQPNLFKTVYKRPVLYRNIL